jgi:hypothetical protein
MLLVYVSTWPRHITSQSDVRGWTLSSCQLLKEIFPHSLTLIWAFHLTLRNLLGHPCYLWFRKWGEGYQDGKRLLSYPGRELLVKTVLTAIPTYYLTRNFLWKSSNPGNVKRGHYLINWRTCQRSRRLGGLGIKDLEKFNRAPRLRWLWYNWDPEERHWKKLFRHDDHIDRSLFFASTYVIIGNGKATPFWEARWLHGVAPKDIAPKLFKETRFKKRSVHCDLKNNNWIRSLGKVDTSTKLDEYVTILSHLLCRPIGQQR